MTDSLPSPLRQWPDRPNLAQIKRQAKELHKAFLAGEAAAVAEIDHYEHEPGPTSFALNDAQRVLARSYGFASWSKLSDRFTSPLTLDDLYGAWNTVPADFFETLDQSLNPRSREMLYDKMATLGCNDTHHVLDVGCWAAHHSIKLTRQFGCRVTGVDYMEAAIAKARQAIEKEQLGDLIKAVQGDIHHLESLDGEFDFIWCRDMLPNVKNIRQAMAECSRVLKPGGHMVIFTFLETDLMEPNEAARLYGNAVFPESMARDSVESAVADAGFSILERDEVSTEWREREEEEGAGIMGKEFLRIARMNRSKDDLIAKYGQTMYEAELIGSLWYASEVLGKLMAVVYVAIKPE
jgi:ubiquinone/menaquinone biosynthesis C-methylase UbiE